MQKIIVIAVAAIAMLTGCHAKYDPNEEFFHRESGARVIRATAVAHNMTEGIVVVCELSDKASYLGSMAEADRIISANPDGFKCYGWKGN